MSKRKSIKARLIETPAVVSALAAVLTAQQKYHATLNDLQEFMHPQDGRAAISSIIGEATDALTLRAAVKHGTDLEGEAAREAHRRAQVLARQALNVFGESLPPLLTAAEAAIAELKGEAVAAESELFDAFGMDREETGVSKRLKRFENDIEDFRVSVQGIYTRNDIYPTVNALSHVIDYFRAS